MDELVDALDLDAFATRQRDEEKAARRAAQDNEEEEDEMEGEE